MEGLKISSAIATVTSAGSHIPVTSTVNKKRSVMWCYFVKMPNDRTRAVCKICKAKVSSTYNTTHLHKHLRIKHPDVYVDARNNEHRILEENMIEMEEKSFQTSFISENEHDTEARVERTQRGPKKHSVVWEYFIRIKPGYGRCTLCGSILKNQGGSTTQFFKHLKSKHPSAYKDAMAEKKLRAEGNDHLSIQEVLNSPSSPLPEEQVGSCKSKLKPGNTSSAKFDTAVSSSLTKMTATTLPRKNASSDKGKDKVNKSLIKLISVNLLPPSIVEVREFKEMLKALDGRYELPTKTAVLKTLIPDFAFEIKNRLRVDVDSASHFALTVETWTYRHGQKCVTVMAHFIKDSWEMSAVALETIDCPVENTSESMIQEIRRITDEWGISDKVVSLVSDHSETLSTVALTMGWEHLFCFGEMLNSIIQTALQSVPEVTKILTKVNEVAEYFDKSIKATEILLSVQQQHNLPENCLKTDVENKWISTYRMMERMSEQFEAANTVLCYHGKDDMCLCDEDVELMRSISKVLQPFQSVIKELSSIDFPGMSKVIPLRNVLQEVVGNSVDDSIEPTVSLSTFRDFLVQQMEAKFCNLEKNSTLALCTLLDPRFKNHIFIDRSAMEAAQDQLLQEMTLIAKSSCEEAVTKEEAIVKEKCDNNMTSIWSSFDRRVSEAGVTKSVSSDVENESRRYFKEALIPRSHDPLEWWKLNQVQFPHLHVLAKKYLCIPATSVCSSRLFFKKGEEFNSRRSKINPSNLKAMIFLSSNLRVA